MNSLKLIALTFLLGATTAFAQTDLQDAEVIQVSPYRGNADFRASFAALDAHITGTTPPDNIRRYEFLKYYQSFITVMRTKDEMWCMVYYNPTRQSRSQIDHDMDILRQFIYDGARIIKVKEGIASQVLWTK